MDKRCCIILAAGDGKRMNSANPKVLMTVLFEPMLGWVLDSVRNAGIKDENVGVITGSSAIQVAEYLESKGQYRTFLQEERKGTGHAVMQAEKMLREFSDDGGDVLVLCGDAPFMDAGTINAAYELHKSRDSDVTVITANVDPAGNYGRVKRDKNTNLLSAIVEMKDCTPDELKITEVNSGAYWFKSERLIWALPQLRDNNKSGEFYLTDTVELLVKSASTYMANDSIIVLGANDRRQLRKLNDMMTEMINNRHYVAGVDIIGHNVIIGKDVKIARDTLLMPNTIIRGQTEIGSGCVIGPNTQISDCKIGDNVTLNSVQAFDAVIHDNVKAGPFVHIRPGTTLHKNVKIGDFVEIKNSEIGEGTALAHLTYIGDSDVGKNVNFGCGTVTANYDGLEKHRTIIGDNAFIGCNTNLIAPVEVGDNATTAAGSTIAKNVPAGALAIERGQLNVKEDWYKNKLRLNKDKAD
ncbi:MAG: bifunctional UDP-N-acetylglucosamine diphosphorylase/glucosamine-1-phosphate N-acetyltransferase GlmU [Oscillospiraceae bacterium]|nr:bifunctional UDP-N-acetylglucosamine diphosphorylase/glucosamine-1-phosphate N-acetyltransferase GlmU [Oscillospiraceae bacterium]